MIFPLYLMENQTSKILDYSAIFFLKSDILVIYKFFAHM